MGFRETLQDRRQVSKRVVIRGAQTNGSGDLRRTECRRYLVVQRKHLAGTGQQVMTVRRQFHAAALAAGQHRLAERVLKPLDLHRDRGLRAPDASAGLGEAVPLGDQHEGAEQISVETLD